MEYKQSGTNYPPVVVQAQSQPMGMIGPLGCPPGLEYLTLLDQLLVRQEVELFEALTNIETKNRFMIANRANQKCYYAYEESECLERICCAATRGVVFHIVDNAGYEVLRATRPFKVCAGCCWCANRNCCAQEMLVESPPGTVIGKIWQEHSSWAPRYQILTPNDIPVFEVDGPCCVMQGVCCTCDYDFLVRPMGGNPATVACITKTYGGMSKECCTDATNFSLSFPLDLDVKMKACFLALTLLIDLMFFEKN